jgi:hypothetical protein
MKKAVSALKFLSLALFIAAGAACTPSEPAGEEESDSADTSVSTIVSPPAADEGAQPSEIESPAPASVAEAAVETGTPQDGGPRLVVEAVNDLGEVENDGPIDFSFVLKNEGDAPLEILEVKPSCGCTEATLESNTIEPNESTVLTAALDLPTTIGNTSKNISVMSNDPTEPRKILTVKANLVKYVGADPQQFAFNAFAMDEVISTAIDVQANKEDVSFNIERIEVVDGSTKVASEHFKADSEIVEEGKHYKVTLTTTPPLPLQVSLYGEVNIYTDNENYEKITVPYRGTALGPLVITPATMLLPQGQPGLTSFTRNILVRGGMTKEFKVLGVETPNDTMKAKIVERPNIGYLVELTNIEPTEDLAGKEIIIETDVESMKEIRIPIKLMGGRDTAVQPAS